MTSARRFGTLVEARRSATIPIGSRTEPSDLIDPAAGVPDLADFPETWPLGDARAAPHLRARSQRPTSTAWWWTCRCRCSTPSGDAGLEWQVPGRRLDLVTALIRSLPKDLRRRHTPVVEAAAEVLERIGPEDGPLLETLAAALSERGGPAIAPRHLDLAAVPDHAARHLPSRRRRRPAAGLEQGPRRPAAPARRARPGRAGGRVTGRRGARRHRLGVRHHPADGRRSTHAGHAVTGHPALVDEGDTVGLRVLPSEHEARAAMWGGTRRLLLLRLGSPLRTLDRALPTATKLALGASERASTAEVYRECAAAAVDELLVAHGGPVRDEAAFEDLVAAVRAGFAGAAVRLAGIVAEALGHAASIDATLATMLTTAHDETVLDARAHLDRLLRRGWIADAGYDQLPDVARYLRALEHRVQKARTDPGSRPSPHRRDPAARARVPPPGRPRRHRRGPHDARGAPRQHLRPGRRRQGRRERDEGPPSPRWLRATSVRFGTMPTRRTDVVSGVGRRW